MSIELQPHLSGHLISLRPLKPDDFEDLFKVSSDPLVWEQHPERFRYQRDVFEKFFKGAINSKGALVAIDKQTGEVMGTSRYNDYDPEKNSIEVGYTFLARKYWGHKHNHEMKKLMLEHAFQFVDKVYFYIGEKNIRSRRAVENIGGTFVRILERQPVGAAKNISAVYVISKSEFAKGPLNKVAAV